MTRQSPHHRRWDITTLDYHLRWSSVLRTWRQKMQSLKVFKMGFGDWDGQSSSVVARARLLHPTGSFQWTAKVLQPMDLWTHRYHGTHHLNYGKPAPPSGPIFQAMPRGYVGLSLNRCISKYIYDPPPYDPIWEAESVVRDGVGLTQARECTLQYIHFNVGLGPGPWTERDFEKSMTDESEDGRQRYEAGRRSDEEALNQLLADVHSRAQG